MRRACPAGHALCRPSGMKLTDTLIAYWHRLPPRLRRPAELVWHTLIGWVDDGGPQMGATIAFYSIFALAPLLVVAIALAGMVFGPEAARGQIVGQIASLVGTQAAKGVEAIIASAWREDDGLLAALIGVGTLLVGASGVFVELRRALNAILHSGPAPSGLTAFVKARLTAFALVLGFGFLSIVSLIVSAALAAVSAFFSSRYPALEGVITVVDLVSSTLLIGVAFAVLLRWLPDTRPNWRVVVAGAFISALLFAVGKHLIGLYLGRASVASSYGAAGSFVVLLMWVYYSSQILLLGAAFGRALETTDPRRPTGAGPTTGSAR